MSSTIKHDFNYETMINSSPYKMPNHHKDLAHFV